MRRIFGCGLVMALFLACGLARAGAPKAQVASLKQLQALMREGGIAQGTQFMGQVFAQSMTRSFGHSLPCVPARYWQGLFDKRQNDALIRALAFNYMFGGLRKRSSDIITADDADRMLVFLRTPAGRILAKVYPRRLRRDVNSALVKQGLPPVGTTPASILSDAEVSQLVGPYRSPLGRKVVRLFPAFSDTVAHTELKAIKYRAARLLKALARHGNIDAQARCPAPGTLALSLPAWPSLAPAPPPPPTPPSVTSAH